MVSEDFFNDPAFEGASRRMKRALKQEKGLQVIQQSVPKLEPSEDDPFTSQGNPARDPITGWNDLWDNEVFKGAAPLRGQLMKSREFFKEELAQNISLGEMFPSIENSSFDSLTLKKSCVEIWTKPIGDEPAGIRVSTELEFCGTLADAFSAFKEFLGESAKPGLRLTARLGVLTPDNQVWDVSEVTFSGNLWGLNVEFPPVIALFTVLSLGVKVTLRQQSSTKPALEWAVIGTAQLGPASRSIPLMLDFTAIYTGTVLRFRLTIQHQKDWKDALGVSGFDLTKVTFEVSTPIGKQKEKPGGRPVDVTDLLKAQTQNEALYFSVTASWERPGTKAIKIIGQLYTGAYKAKSFFEASAENITWNDVKSIFSGMYAKKLDDSRYAITCDKLSLRVSPSTGLVFSGALCVDGCQCASAFIKINRSGIEIDAKVTKWQISGLEDVFIEDARLHLLIGRSGRPKPSSETATPGSAVEGEPEDPEPSQSGTAAESTEPIPKTIKKEDREGIERPSAPGKNETQKTGTVPEGSDPAKSTEQASLPSNVPKESGGWQGGLTVSGNVTFHKVQFSVRLVVATIKDKWGYVLAGKVEMNLSLRDIIESIEPKSNLDLKLTQVSILATNLDKPELVTDTYGFPIRKGIFMYALLDTVPLLEGQSVSKTVPTDRCCLSFGKAAELKWPMASIHLPSSFKINMGPRASVQSFHLDISPVGDRGPSISLSGSVEVRLEEKRPPLLFKLVAKGDAIGCEGSLDMMGYLENPLGLSERIALGPQLGIGLGSTWVVLATTLLPDTLDIRASLVLDKDYENAYRLFLRASSRPDNLLLDIQAPYFDYGKLCQLIDAVTCSPVQKSAYVDLKMKGVQIYGSTGVNFGGVDYPKGFRLKGSIILNGEYEAGMDCSLTTMGCTLKAWLPTFHLGPLSVSGPVELDHAPGKKFAVLDMALTYLEQKFFLQGEIKLFGSTAMADIQCQFMPIPKFHFEFKLAWSDLLMVHLKAVMIGTECMNKPRNASWLLKATFDHRITEELVNCIKKVLLFLHETAKKGLESAQQAVASAKEKYEGDLEAAMAALRKEEASVESKEAEFLEKLNNMKSQTSRGKAEKYSMVEIAETNKVHADAAKERELDAEKEQRRAQVKYAKNNLEKEERESKGQHNKAVADRDNKKRDFMGQFGNVDWQIQVAEEQVNWARDRFYRLDRQAQSLSDQIPSAGYFKKADLIIQATVLSPQVLAAGADWRVQQCVLEGIKAALRSELFQNLRSLWEAAERVLNTLWETIQATIRQVTDQLNNAVKGLEAVELAFQGRLDEAKKVTAATVENAKASYAQYSKEQADREDKLELEIQLFKGRAYGVTLAALRNTAQLARDNTQAFDLATTTLKGLEKIEGKVFETLNDFVTTTAKSICDIQHICLKGVISADTKDQKPFKIRLKGKIAGKEFRFAIVWTPGQNGGFLVALGQKAKDLVLGKNVNDDDADCNHEEEDEDEVKVPAEKRIKLRNGDGDGDGARADTATTQSTLVSSR